MDSKKLRVSLLSAVVAVVLPLSQLPAQGRGEQLPINQATTWTWTPDAGQPGGSEVWQGSGSGNGATAISAPGGPYDWQSGGQYYDNGGGPNPRRWRIKKVGEVWKAEKWESQGGNWVQVSEGTLSHSAPLE